MFYLITSLVINFFDLKINFENFNNLFNDELQTRGKLDKIFVNFEEKFYGSLEEKLSYSNYINILKGNNYLDVEVNKEKLKFSWDSIKINNYDKNLDFQLIHLNNTYELLNAEVIKILHLKKYLKLAFLKK